ncbi:MFS transporter [Ilumatobacter sp.]|uniref:MFS transporter n=1 Tax=Ilumatobacter sp. TaxID=1967498 RepID=UPI003C4F83C4
MLLVTMDQTITVVVVPDIVAAFGTDVAATTLLVTLYLVVAASTMVLMGRIADLHGRRRVIVGALVLFAIATILGGLAPNFGILLSARILQGLVLGAYVPASLGLLNVTFPDGDPDRVKAYAVFTTVVGAGLALGPLVGGALADAWSWRAAFLVQAPIAVIGAIGVHRFASESRDWGRDRRLDLVGAGLLLVGVGSIVFALQEGGTYGFIRTRQADMFGVFEWPSAVSPMAVLLAVGFAASAALVIVEAKREERGWPVMLNRKLLKVRSFRNGELTVSLMSVSFYGSLLLIPIYTQFVLGFGSVASGLIVFAIGAGITVGGMIAQSASDRFSDRTAGLGAVALQALAMLILLGAVLAESGWILVPPLFVLGVGFGVALALLSGVLMSQVPDDLASLAAGTSTTIRNTTQAVGAAILTSVLLATTTADVTKKLDAMPDISTADKQTIEQAADFSANNPPLGRSSGTGAQTIAELHDQPRLRPAFRALNDSYTDGTLAALGVAAVFALLAVGIGLRIPKQSASSTEYN